MYPTAQHKDLYSATAYACLMNTTWWTGPMQNTVTDHLLSCHMAQTTPSLKHDKGLPAP